MRIFLDFVNQVKLNLNVPISTQDRAFKAIVYDSGLDYTYEQVANI